MTRSNLDIKNGHNQKNKRKGKKENKTPTDECIFETGLNVVLEF
jgi:hypothetical protein